MSRTNAQKKADEEFLNKIETDVNQLETELKKLNLFLFIAIPAL